MKFIERLKIGLLTLILSTVIANAVGIAGPDQNLTLTSSHRAVLLEATPLSGATSYKWYEGNSFIGPHLTRWYTLNTVGTHTITLKAYDAGGSLIESDTLDVNVSYANVTNTGTLSANAGADITHTVTPSNRQIHLMGIATEGTSHIVKKEWFLEGSKIWDGDSRWYTLVTPGEHHFTFKVTDADGNVESDTMVVTIVRDTNGTLSADAGLDRLHTVTPSHRQVHLVGTATEGTSHILKKEWFLEGTKIGI